MKYLFKSLLACCFFFLLAACSTGYQNNSFWRLNGGYSETQLSEDVYRISFKGNGYTSLEKASDFTLLRAAEIGLEKGFTHFLVVENDEKVKTEYTEPDYSCSNIGNNINCRPSGGGSVRKPRTTSIVKYFKNKPARASNTVYDAKFVFNSISNKYSLKQAPAR